MSKTCPDGKNFWCATVWSARPGIHLEDNKSRGLLYNFVSGRYFVCTPTKNWRNTFNCLPEKRDFVQAARVDGLISCFYVKARAASLAIFSYAFPAMRRTFKALFKRGRVNRFFLFDVGWIFFLLKAIINAL